MAGLDLQFATSSSYVNDMIRSLKCQHLWDQGQMWCGHARSWSPKGRRGKETLYVGATDLDLNVEHLVHHLSALTTWSQVPSK